MYYSQTVSQDTPLIKVEEFLIELKSKEEGVDEEDIFPPLVAVPTEHLTF